MSKVIDEVRRKLACGQSLFRRSTIEKILAEYDRVLMRNTALEKSAVEHQMHPTAFGVDWAAPGAKDVTVKTIVPRNDGGG